MGRRQSPLPPLGLRCFPVGTWELYEERYLVCIGSEVVWLCVWVNAIPMSYLTVIDFTMIFGKTRFIDRQWASRRNLRSWKQNCNNSLSCLYYLLRNITKYHPIEYGGLQVTTPPTDGDFWSSFATITKSGARTCWSRCYDMSATRALPMDLLCRTVEKKSISTILLLRTC